MTELVYTNKDFSGHSPSADSFSRKENSSHAAAFPAVKQLFPSSIPAPFAQQQGVIQKQDAGVAQLEKDEEVLLTLILAALLSTPELLGMWGLVGAFAFSAFLTWFRANRNNKEAIQMITPLCNRIGYDPQQVVNHLNQDNGGFSPGEVNKFCDDYYGNTYYKQSFDFGNEEVINPLGRRGLVPPMLIQNLVGDDQKKVDTIFSRLNKFGFIYIGQNAMTLDGFMNRKGDCHTLSKMFIEAVATAGIEGVEIDYSTDSVLVEPRQIHGRSAMGNVEGDPSWFFTNHYWCTYNGQIYDLLFMMKGLPPSHTYTEMQEHKTVKFMTFDNDWCMITEEEAEDRMGMKLGGKLGIMKTSSQAMRAFINANKSKIITQPQNELDW